jgi:hypothetical protein
MNHVLAQPLLLQGSDDDEIASATDVSDDGENDMWVFSHIILTLMIYWNLSISDSVKYLIILQKIRSKCETLRRETQYNQYLCRGCPQSVPSQLQATVGNCFCGVPWPCQRSGRRDGRIYARISAP